MFLKLFDLYKKGEYNLLLNHFSLLEKKNFKDSKIENLRGLVNFNIGNYKEAIKFFENSINIQKNYIDPYINLGTYYLSKKDLKKSEEFFLKALDINSKSPVVLNHLGMIEAAKKNLIKPKVILKIV